MQRWGQAVVLGAALMYATQAHAYVVSKHGDHTVRWYEDDIELRVLVSTHGMLKGVSLQRALVEALDAWRAVAVLPEVEVIAEGRDLPAGYDPLAQRNYNTVQVLEDWPFDPDNLAVTVTNLSADDRILDADIFVNASAYDFTDATHPNTPGDYFDLPAVLTHELGHLFGLDESPNIQEATMFPYIAPVELRARTLDADDVAGVTEIYAASAAQKMSDAGASAAQGCSVRGEGPKGAVWLLVLFAALLVRASKQALRPALLAAMLTACAGPVDDAPQSALDDATASPRKSADVADADDVWFEGQVEARETTRRGGLLFTRLRIVDDEGQELSAEVMGGELDGVTQQVFHQAIPKPGERVVTTIRKGKVRGFRTIDDRPVTGKALSLRSQRTHEE